MQPGPQHMHLLHWKIHDEHSVWVFSQQTLKRLQSLSGSYMSELGYTWTTLDSERIITRSNVHFIYLAFSFLTFSCVPHVVVF